MSVKLESAKSGEKITSFPTTLSQPSRAIMVPNTADVQFRYAQTETTHIINCQAGIMYPIEADQIIICSEDVDVFY